MTTPWTAFLLLASLMLGSLVVAPPDAGEKRPPPSLNAVVKLEVHPAQLRLDDQDETTRVIVIATLADGTMKDVTELAAISVSDPRLARMRGDFRLEAAGEGQGLLHATFEGATATAEVIAGNRPPRARSFAMDVLPILTRHGCNAGGCHGAALGKNGFRLSLFGFDAAKDHVRLTRELRGRRLDVLAPENSLILKKPSTEVTHKGGHVLDRDSTSYATLAAWIAEGAPPPRNDEAALTAIELLPRDAVFAGPGAKIRLVARATYADGTDRDVTDLALLSSMNESSARVDAAGAVHSSSPGQAIVMARFGHLATISQVLVLDPALEPPPASAAPENTIDRLIEARQRKMRLIAAPRSDDATFARRVCLDIVGVPPSADEARAFVNDPAADKRERLVDRLLERPEFPDVWALQWAEVLRIESRQLKEKGMHHYTAFLKDAFRKHRPFDEVVREILTASGGSFENAAANFWLVETDAKALAENVAQVFLGIRLQCAQCHNHPFERWTMDDYYGFAGFFSQVGRKTGEDTRERIVFDRKGGEINHPKDGRVLPPRFLGGEIPKFPPGEDRRAVLAAWLTAPENPWFAAHVANRIFARFLGRGLVEPPDDVRVSNPPSHPELARHLAQRLVESRFDFRPLIREICASAAYQQATSEDASPPAAFRGARLRRLGAEQLIEAIGQVTGIAPRFNNLPAGARATEVEDADPRNPFLDIFGRSRRQTVALCERKTEPTLSQSLHLINGPAIETRIRNDAGRIRRLVKDGATDRQIVEDLYWNAYARAPTEAEVTARVDELAGAKDRRDAIEDLAWAILNSREFLFNH